MLPRVAVSTQADQVIEGVVAQLAPLDLVAGLQIQCSKYQAISCALHPASSKCLIVRPAAWSSSKWAQKRFQTASVGLSFRWLEFSIPPPAVFPSQERAAERGSVVLIAPICQHFVNKQLCPIKTLWLLLRTDRGSCPTPR